MSTGKSTKSGRVGPLEKFCVPLEGVRRAVAGVCRRYGCAPDHVEEAFCEVLVKILDAHSKGEVCFESAGHIIGYARTHAKFVHLNVFDSAAARRLEYRDSLAMDTVAAGGENDERQQLLNLLSDCERVISLLAEGAPEVAEVFRMHHCKQMDGEAIAQQLGRGKVTVWRRLRIAYAILRRKLRVVDLG